jgi:hypothetical protein
MRGKHVIFGPDGRMVLEEEVEDWEGTWGPFPPPVQSVAEIVELVRTAVTVDDLKRVLLMYLGGSEAKRN